MYHSSYTNIRCFSFNLPKAPLTTSFAGIPRLGHSKDISRLGLLLSDQASQEQASDYLFGLSFVAGFIFSYFLLWGLGLCLSKCLSQSFLGGLPFVQVPTQNEDESEAEKQTGRISSLWTRMGKSTTAPCHCLQDSSGQLKAVCAKSAFFIAGSLVIVFAILLGVMGTSKMQDTSSEIETTSGTLKEMLGEATHVSVLLHSLHALSAALHDRIELEYENPCPGFEAYDTSDLGKKMNDAFGSTLDKLKTLKVDLEEGVDLLEDEIKNIEDGVDTFDRAVQDANDYELMGKLKCHGGWLVSQDRLYFAHCTRLVRPIDWTSVLGIDGNALGWGGCCIAERNAKEIRMFLELGGPSSLHCAYNHILCIV